jgi:Flp pilus assembly pilin Flp
MINVNTLQVKEFITSDNAQGLMEYSLILMLVALGVMSVLGKRGEQLKSLFDTLQNEYP